MFHQATKETHADNHVFDGTKRHELQVVDYCLTIFVCSLLRFVTFRFTKKMNEDTKMSILIALRIAKQEGRSDDCHALFPSLWTRLIACLRSIASHITRQRNIGANQSQKLSICETNLIVCEL